MKKYILLIAIVVASLQISNAQGNLQFNQVINQSFSLTDNGNYQTLSLGTLTVPAGKVYKIESATMMANYSGRVGTHSKSVSLGDHLIWMGSSAAVNIFPIWLSPGSYPIEFLNIANGSEYLYKLSISAIEFNVIP